MQRNRLLLVLVCSLVCASVAQAKPVMPDQKLAGQSGAALRQEFRPDGSSVVTSVDTKVCVVSRRIDIETSTYRAAAGGFVPFADIRRSPASSVQAVADTVGVQGFRVQLKYSPRLSDPITLQIGSQVFDLRTAVEPSTDSLWIVGPAAAALAAGFRTEQRGKLIATSVDTTNLVTDVLVPMDMAALDRCQADIAKQTPDDPQLTNEIRVSFVADPKTTPLATLPELRTCGMTDPPGRLHIAQLDSVTGFFAQTDKVFVSFDDAGQVAQAYIPGIFEADFRNGGRMVRISRAADGNLPTAPNAVKGCLGAAAQTLCDYTEGNGTGHLLADCVDGNGLADQELAGLPEAPTGLGQSITPPGQGGGIIPSGGGIPIGGGGTTGGGGGTNPPPPPPDPDPSPVPLPATGFLLFAATLGLSVLRRRKA
jgi:hypothetical protein